MSIINKRDLRIMDFLRRQAIDNQGASRAKIAAAVVIKNNIISTGRNQYKTHPMQSQYAKNPDAIFLHAEISAISNSLNHISKQDLERATLYIYRVKREDNHPKKWTNGLAKPCRGCMGAIAEFGFRRTVYSTDEPGVYKVLS